MGGTESKTAAMLTSNTTVINQSSLNYMNSLVNNAAINTMIESVKKCSASIIQNQKLTIKNIKCGDNCNIALFQDQTAWLDFTCAQKDDVQMEVINKMIDTINQSLNSGASNDLVNKMNSNLKTKSQQEWGTFPWSGSTANTDLKQNINNYVQNKNNTNITNAIQNSVYANFKNSNINECITKIISNQEISAQDISAGKNFSFTINQSQTSKLISSCIQNSNVTNRVVADVTKFAGLDLQIKNDTGVSTESTATTETTAVNSGFLQGIGSVFSGIGSAFSNILSGFGLTALTPFMAPSSASSSMCCLCLCCLLILVLLMGGMSGDNSTADLSTADYQ